MLLEDGMVSSAKMLRFKFRSLKIIVALYNFYPNEKNERKLLNFGHTIGHAIESWSNGKEENAITHGEAVAIGLIAESFLSYRKSFISFDELKEICDSVNLYFNPVFIPEEDFETIIEFMKYDKKEQG